MWLKEKEIQKVVALQKISFVDARKLVDGKNMQSTYASKATITKCNAATQYRLEDTKTMQVEKPKATNNETPTKPTPAVKPKSTTSKPTTSAKPTNKANSRPALNRPRVRKGVDDPTSNKYAPLELEIGVEEMDEDGFEEVVRKSPPKNKNNKQ